MHNVTNIAIAIINFVSLYSGIAMALVKHPHWYQFLRYTEMGEDGIPTTPFREMIKKMPGHIKANDRL